jgi:hypothetical protein
LDRVLDHPKLSGAVALIALGTAFSPRVNETATWVLLFFAQILTVACIAGALKDPRRLAKTIAASIVCAILIFSYGWWITHEDTFSVKSEMVNGGESTYTPAWWWMLSSDGKEVYQAPIVMSLEVRAIKSAAMVRELKIRIKPPGGEKLELTQMSTLDMIPMLGPDPHHLCEVQALFLDRELANHTLGAGEIVRGWEFFDYPREATRFVGLPNIYAEIVPMDGATYGGKVNPVKDYGWGGEQNIWYKTDVCKDFGDRKVVHYRDIPGPL